MARSARHGQILVSLAILVLVAGCLPTVRVCKHPGIDDQGIRYYRPKPFLLVTPVESKTKVSGKEFIEVTTTGEYVQIQLEYLPDFSEEYSITVTPGLGAAEVGISLENGWNLTKVSQDLDSHVDDSLKAVADVIDSVASLGAEHFPTSGATPDEVQQRWVIRASNVPLGYYEAVVHPAPCGKKRLCGWQYVGFAPFTTGSMVAGAGGTCGVEPIFGLVFEAGAMTFKPLPQVHADSLGAEPSRIAVATGVSTLRGGHAERQSSGDVAVGSTGTALRLGPEPGAPATAAGPLCDRLPAPSLSD